MFVIKSIPAELHKEYNFYGYFMEISTFCTYYKSNL